MNKSVLIVDDETATADLMKEELDIRGLSVNKSSHICTLNGRELSLTPIEFDILWYLCKNQGRVVSSEELFESV